MAEYAGLEIRIGGNTSKLNDALKASMKSASELQSRIRQATRAMQFDPTNLSNVDTKIKLTGDRMQSLQTKVKLTQTAMEQLGNSTTSLLNLNGTPKTVRQIASETQNLSLAAKQADERYNKLTGSLAKVYEAWNGLSRSKGADYLISKLEISPSEAENLMKGTTSLKTFTTELKNLQQLRADPIFGDGNKLISDAELKRAEEFKKLNFHDMFKRGLGLDDMIDQAEKLGITIEDSAIDNVRKLQGSFKEAQQEKEALDKALSFEQMGNDIQRTKAEIEGLSQEMRKLDDAITPAAMTDEFQSIEAKVRQLDAALDSVNNDLERTENAMEFDPSNLELAKRYFSDLQQQASLSEEKVELLKQQMDMLNANGVNEAAKGHQDLAKWVEESAEAARTAQKDLSNQRAEVSNLDDQVKSLSQSISNMKGDSVLSAYSDKVIEWRSSTEKLNSEMERLARSEANVAKEQSSLAEIQGQFDKATSEVDAYKSKLDALKSEYGDLERAAEKAFDNGDFVDQSMLNYMSGLQVEIERVETAYEGAKYSVGAFNKELKDQKSRVDYAQGSLDQQRTKVEDLKRAVSELEKTSEVRLFKNPDAEIEKAEAKLKDLRSELGSAMVEEKRLASAYKAAETENELAKSASKVQELGAELAETKNEAESASNALRGLNEGGIINPSTIKSLGMTLSATITPLASMLGYKMVDATSTIDAAYRDMRKTVNGTEEQFEHLREAAIDFSRTHVTSADQILQIEAIGGELGIATENLETFAEVISNIDVATNLDVEDAAESLGHLANIMKLSESDYVGFSDALVRLGNNGASTETEIANIAERIGAMGSIVGMSASDVLAWASTIASTGQNAEAAGTAVSKTMSFFETAVASAGGTIDTSFDAINSAVEEGGDKLTVFASLAGMTAEDFAQSWETNSEQMASDLNEQLGKAKDNLQMIADVAHMSADDLAKMWESDPTSVMKAFIEGLNDLEASGGSADKVLGDLGITAVRQKQAIEGLMQTVGGLDDNLRMSRDAWSGISDQWGEAGDAANEASKKAEGFSGQIQILKNMAQIALSELGEGAVPHIKAISGVLQEFSQWFSGLSSSSKSFIVSIGGIMAAIGPMLSLAGTFGTMKTEMAEWMTSAVNASSAVRNAFKTGGQEAVDALVGSMSAMDKFKLSAKALGTALLGSLKVVAITAAIIALGAAIKSLYDNWKTHIKATSGLSDALMDVGKASEYMERSSVESKATLAELASGARGYESRLASLTDTIGESNKQYGTLAGQMDYYANTISALGDKSGRSQEETYKLSAALKAVNDACGTTYGLDEYGNIIDTETGKIQENTDEILKNIDARKAQALIDYYSDDYQKAVGENADAQDRLNEAQERYNELVSDAGHKQFLDDLKEAEGASYNAAVAESAYNIEVGRAEDTVRKYQTEVNKTGDAMRTLEGKISGAMEEQQKANEVLEEAARAQEELDKRSETVASDVTGNMKKLSDAVTKIGGSDSGFNVMAETLSAIRVGADELNDVDMSGLAKAFDNTSGSMEQIVSTLEDGGVVMETWNNALEQAPGAAEKMSSITGDAFDAMYEIADGDLNNTMTLISGLETVMGDVNGQQVLFYIGDNGSIIDAQGRVYDIEADLASIPNEVITQYYVDDADAQQKALDTKASLNDVDNTNPNPTISVTDNASGPTDTLQGKLNTLGTTNPNPTVGLNDYASVGIDYISSRLNALDGSGATVTVTTVEKTVKQATGGLNNRPVIPRHASGYIATGPTLTNQGWIGEDGIEAVANWATGGAVVPLTNRKYMLPIADAIADGMANRMVGVGGPTYNLTINAGSGDANEIANAVTRELRAFELMRGRK